MSVTGYLPRMHQSFGEIYLGLDAGQDGAYEQESAACNDAIMALDKQYAFERARTSTKVALQALVDEAIGYATADGETSWDLTVDVRELVDPLLAEFCEEWFGLSKTDNYFHRGGYRWDWRPGQPPAYPGHFLAPSRYFFQPRPGQKVREIGAAHGVAVRRAMLEFLRRHGARINAPVARAVLNSHGASDLDFAARTIIGAVIGFVPTVTATCLRVLNEWLREGTLWSLRARLGGTTAASFLDACNRLGADFIPAMQLRTAPELVWRTAKVAHTLGEYPHEVAVSPGEIVVAGAISATQQSLQQGRLELHHAFGGNRKAAAHPTHACPGADPALAVMLGFFSALVESPLRLRAGPGPLTLALDGRLPSPDEAFHLRKRATISIDPDYDRKFDADTTRRQRVAATPLLAIGDSWFFDQWERDYGVVRPNLIKSLLPLGYKDSASSTKDFSYAGRKLRDMAKVPFLNSVKNYIADEPSLKALLVGGGGNDVVAGLSGQQPLFKMLLPRSAGAPQLNDAEVSSFIDGTLFNYYNTIINTLTAVTSVPILIHGYDHPIPDGRGDTILGFSIGPWLKPIFVQRGYDMPKFPNSSADLALARDVMLRLIDRLNGMVASVAAAHANVHHVSLTGTLAQAYGNNYTTHWNNELHPNGNGFDLLCKGGRSEIESSQRLDDARASRPRIACSACQCMLSA